MLVLNVADNDCVDKKDEDIARKNNQRVEHFTQFDQTVIDGISHELLQKITDLCKDGIGLKSFNIKGDTLVFELNLSMVIATAQGERDQGNPPTWGSGRPPMTINVQEELKKKRGTSWFWRLVNRGLNDEQ